MKNGVKVTILLIFATTIIPVCVLNGASDGDTVWVGSTWFLTNPNAGRVVRDMPYDTVDVDTSILNGFSWNDEERITYFDEKCFYPSIAVSGDYVHVSYDVMWAVLDPEVFYQSSTNAGCDWSDSLILSETGGVTTSGMPTVRSSDSTVYVTWNEAGPTMYYRDIRMKRSSDSGFTWSDPIIIQEDIWSDYIPYWVNITVHRDSVFATYTRRYADGHWQRFRLSADRGDSWSEEYIIGENAAGGSASIDYSGGLIAVVLGRADLEVHYHSSTDYGETWSDDLVLSDAYGEASQWPEMACDGQGGIYAIWFDYNGSPYPTTGYILLRRSTNWGNTWEPIVSLSTLPTGMESCVHADSNGVYVAWRDERQGSPDTDIYFRMSTDMGSTWTPEIRLDNAPNPSDRPCIDAEGDLIHLIWRDQRGMEWALYHRLGGYYEPGDADQSGEVDIDDAVYLIGYIFSAGDPPIIYRAGDSDCSGMIDIDDAVYLILFIFSGGPPPC